MPDVIHLLSDHIANQIAAGEVIQRPASAVKELLENAIDAGATEIQLIVKDAGKELIQVIDNGKGMSATDARMCFERHATSKIQSIDDLFRIRTMGFRGEALASIAAVTQVEMRTRQQDAETGTRIVIEGTEVKSQEACAAPPGTNFMMKNLFYNVPARRHFLKSNNTEFRHIIDEFTRVALANPGIAFKLNNNGAEQFHLTTGALKNRVMGLLGNNWEKKLVPVEETSDLLQIRGFIGKPEAAMRTRGMQFFFLNNRFIRNNYLHHAVTTAYDNLIEKEAFPFYVLFLETDPSRVDVNVHPTKQEVKFEDERLIYHLLQATVKRSLSVYNIAPSLDFTLNPNIQNLPSVQLPQKEGDRTEAQTGYLASVFSRGSQAHFIERNNSLQQWKSLYQIAKDPGLNAAGQAPEAIPQIQTLPSRGSLYTEEEANKPGTNMLLIHGDLLATSVRSGMMLIHVRRAQERIWYERLLQDWNTQEPPSQRLLFPLTYELPPNDAALLAEMLPSLSRIGFDISPFGNNTFAIHGLPAGMPPGEEKNVLDEVIEHLKHESDGGLERRTDLLLAHMARRISRNKHAIQQPEGQEALVDELFACSQPEYTPGGKKVFVMVRREDLEDMLG